MDITVTFGGASSDHVTITSGGTGYSDASNVSTTSSGNGSGCTVDTTTIGGAVSAISINSAGSGYKDGEVLTVAGGSAGTFTLDKVSGAIDGGGIVVAWYAPPLLPISLSPSCQHQARCTWVTMVS